jgi:cytosine/adenosine deaminase-related metal-dependent hydrolase
MEEFYMGKTLFKNCKTIITCDAEDRVLYGEDILVDGNAIVEIGEGLSAEGAEVIDAKDLFIFPGLINTHHHMLQAFSRNIPEIQSYELFDWLMYLYEVWKNVDSNFVYLSSQVAMGELLKYGCTTNFDQHFAFPQGKGRDLIDRQMDAAKELGMRFNAGRSCFTRTQKNGGLPPDELGETTKQFIDDCERLIDTYHDASEFSMRQVTVAPCSPFSVDTEVMVESVRLARAKGVRLHTHLCETIDEENYCLETYGKRPLAWAHECGFTGPDVWYAHGIHFTDEEVAFLGKTQTGVSHCPVSNMKLSSGICKVPLMLEHDVPLGLGVDGCGSNDSSNLLADIRVAYLLHRLNSSNQAPTGYEILKLATNGSARILGRTDIGSLTVGKAADLFALDVSKLEHAGALLDPASFLGTIGYSRPAKLTMVNGKIVYRDGQLLGIDEEKVKAQADAEVAKIYSNL